MRKTLVILVSMIVFAYGVAGCAGGRGAIAFDRMKYPVSSSRFIYGPDDRVYRAAELKILGKALWIERIWGLWWSWIPLSGTVDVSEPINAQIARVGGDGIINLTVSVENCGMNYVPIFNMLPFYPGCAYVTITGDIVKMPEAPPPPPAGATPPPATFIPKDKVRQAISAQMSRLLAAK